MGGGDLNLKKSWHPLTHKNLELIWRLEQEKIEQDKRADALHKELQRERQVLELRRLHAQTTGNIGTVDKMDWMYAGSTQRPASFQEDFLLGRKRVDELLPKDLNTFLETTQPTFLHSPPPSILVQRDLEAKIREDPLFSIKRKEKESIVEMSQNPLIVKRLKEDWSTHSHTLPTPQRKPKRKSTPTWSMSEEERNARLAQMQEDALSHSSSRKYRVDTMRQDAERESSNVLRSYKDRHTTPNFLTETQEKVFSTKSNIKLSSRLATISKPKSDPNKR